jgi:hypothetical protein
VPAGTSAPPPPPTGWTVCPWTTWFGLAPAIDDLRAELAEAIGTHAAAAYLFEELTSGSDGFVISAGTRTLLDKFRRTVGTSAYDDDLAVLTGPAARRQLVEAWLTPYVTATGTEITSGDLAEAVAAELCTDLPRYESDATLTQRVEGLLGAHPRIRGRRLTIRVDEFLARTREFRAQDVPAHRAYQRRRAALVAAERTRLRLDEYRPAVMSAFVRNKLIDEVYLPLVGDSLAKQLGNTGESVCRGSSSGTPGYSHSGGGSPKPPSPGDQDDKSGVTRDCHAPFCGSRGVGFPRATRLFGCPR